MTLSPQVCDFEAVRTHLETLALGDCSMEVCLSVEEAFVNIVFYSHCTSIGYSAEVSDGVLTVVLTDDGLAFDPTAFPPHEYDDNPTAGGLGIDIIRKMMDGMVYERENDTNRLTLTKRLQS